MYGVVEFIKYDIMCEVHYSFENQKTWSAYEVD